MNMSFELFLVLVTLITGLIFALDKLWLTKRRGVAEPSVWVRNAREFFPVFLIVLLLRSFLAEPFRIPSGSLEPSFIPGDFILANKFTYGLRLPVTHTKILSIGTPHRGDITVFRFPDNPDIDFVKRVIGLPGDHIVYRHKVLFINGVEQPQKYMGAGMNTEPGEPNVPVEKYQEILAGVKHDILINPQLPAKDIEITVPANEYFMMGDNRDYSWDSRYWGSVPNHNLVGRAFLIIFNWAGINHGWIHASRIGTIIPAGKS